MGILCSLCGHQSSCSSVQGENRSGAYEEMQAGGSGRVLPQKGIGKWPEEDVRPTGWFPLVCVKWERVQCITTGGQS